MALVERVASRRAVPLRQQRRHHLGRDRADAGDGCSAPIPTGAVEGVPFASLVAPAPRPQYPTLSNAQLAAAGVVLPPWQDALQRRGGADAAALTRAGIDACYGVKLVTASITRS